VQDTILSRPDGMRLRWLKPQRMPCVQR